jgi:hypothetical protein
MADTKNRETATSKRTGDDAGEAQVQQRVDQEQEQGFVGVEVDPTPNENYTVQGVVKKLPTPETDADAAAAAGSTKFGAVKQERR